jgi:hypothetical protein
MSLVDTLSYPDVTAPQASLTMPWQARDVASINRRFSRLDTLPPTHERVCKPVNVISDWALNTTLGRGLLWALIIGVCIGCWTALWFFLPSVVFSVVAGLPVAAGLLVACWTYRREVAARRHLSFRLTRVFGV